MRRRLTSFLIGMGLIAPILAFGQGDNLQLPVNLTAGSAFSIPTIGSGKAALYIVGPGQALRQDVQLGSAIQVPAGVLYNAGHYVAILASGSSTKTGEFNVVPSSQPEHLSFLAKPSRIPVSLPNGISGTVYVFDAYRNLITTPQPVSFKLSNQSGTVQAQTVTTQNGVAWTRMNSASRQGAAQFVASVGTVSSTRVIDQVPGSPCGLTISATPDGQNLVVQTAPVHDCSGNPVPDGTIVTFTERFDGAQTTVDVPIKKGIARVEMPAHPGATISAASGVALGNEIRWGGKR